MLLVKDTTCHFPDPNFHLIYVFVNKKVFLAEKKKKTKFQNVLLLPSNPTFEGIELIDPSQKVFELEVFFFQKNVFFSEFFFWGVRSVKEPLC